MSYEFGETDADDAVVGTSKTGNGVVGRSAEGIGVAGYSDAGHGVRGETTGIDRAGVFGVSEKAQGVWGQTKADRSGVVGKSDKGHGVTGESNADNRSGVVGKSAFRGVTGTSTGKGQGVWGESEGPGTAVHGKSTSGVGVKGISEQAQGVWGEAKGNRAGVVGRSEQGPGVHGLSVKHLGVYGKSTEGAAVRGDSAQHIGVYGMTESLRHAGVHGKGPRLAGFFEGDVEVTGDVILRGADLAEQFEVVGEEAEPGSVMVLAGEDAVRISDVAYDRRVAGVVSGAGGYRPALVMDRHDECEQRRALALTGKVWVRVDAAKSPVEVGDLLTTSATPGHAMKASDTQRAFGAVLGKALDPLPHGRGLIRALVALH